MIDLIPKTEIACRSWANAIHLAESLIPEGYAVMLTKEENLYIVNFLYAGDIDNKQADRNNVVFMNREEYEEEMFRND